MPEIAKLFPIWILGALVRLVKIQIKVNWATDLFSLLMLLLFIYIANRYVNLSTKYLLGVGIATSLLIWQNIQESSFCKFEKIATFFSNFSFSLYAIHFVIVELIIDFLNIYFHLERNGKIPGIQNWLIYLLIVLVTVTFSYLFYLITEKNTYKVRTLMINLVMKN